MNKVLFTATGRCCGREYKVKLEFVPFYHKGKLVNPFFYCPYCGKLEEADMSWVSANAANKELPSHESECG